MSRQSRQSRAVRFGRFGGNLFIGQEMLNFVPTLETFCVAIISVKCIISRAVFPWDLINIEDLRTQRAPNNSQPIFYSVMLKVYE